MNPIMKEINQTNLSNMCKPLEKLHAARSAKLSSVLTLLDFSAPFYSVIHKILLSILMSLKIGSGLLSTWRVSHIMWTEDYSTQTQYLTSSVLPLY